VETVAPAGVGICNFDALFAAASTLIDGSSIDTLGFVSLAIVLSTFIVASTGSVLFASGAGMGAIDAAVTSSGRAGTGREGATASAATGATGRAVVSIGTFSWTIVFIFSELFGGLAVVFGGLAVTFGGLAVTFGT